MNFSDIFFLICVNGTICCVLSLIRITSRAQQLYTVNLWTSHFHILPSEGRGAVPPWHSISSMTKLWIECGSDEKALWDAWNPVRMQISVICAAPVNIYYGGRARTGRSWTRKRSRQHSGHRQAPILKTRQLVSGCRELAVIQQAGQPEAALFLSQGKDSPFAMRRDCIENQDAARTIE